jgi:hypothetical protein
VSATITWPQALAWRMGRQFLEPVGEHSVVDVSRRLCGVQAQVASSAELAIRLRQSTSRSGDVARALADGRLLKTWAMRGTLHLLTPDDGAAFLAMLAAGRAWERPSWQKYFGVTPAQIDALRDAVDTILEGRALTREELIAAVVERPGLDHVGEALASGWGTLLKPLAWQGVLCFGPSQGNRVTFMRPRDASRRWAGVPAVEVAAPAAIVAYLGAHGTATTEAFGNWLAGGYFGTRRLRDWFAELGHRLVAVDIEGRTAWLLAEHLDELAATRPTSAVRLLAGFDQYVLGPGTADEHVVPTARRSTVSRQSGWISPAVLVDGVVRGTWELADDVVRVTWFGEAGRPPRTKLGAEVERLAGILDRPLRVTIEVV